MSRISMNYIFWGEHGNKVKYLQATIIKHDEVNI
jgi:hypothetical protein